MQDNSGDHSSPNLLGLLGLDLEIVTRDLEARAKLGSVFARSRYKQDEPRQRTTELAIAATNYRRAAANSLLIGNRSRARQFFAEAANLYAELHLPYALYLATFTGEIRRDWGRIEFWQGEHLAEGESHEHDLQLVYVLLANEIFDPENKRRNLERGELVRSNLEASRSYPLGILGLSIGNYLQLLDALSPQRRRQDTSIQEALFPFINAYSNAIRQASADTFHWRRLALPFHPLEPDIFGLMLMVHMNLRRTDRGSLLSYLEAMPLASATRTVFSYVIKQFSEGDHE